MLRQQNAGLKEQLERLMLEMKEQRQENERQINKLTDTLSAFAAPSQKR